MSKPAIVLCVFLFFGAGLARAQDAPAPPAESSRIEKLSEQLRVFKERLPFQLGAGVYLYYYQPVESDSTLAGGSLDGTFQVFFYYLKLDAELHGFGAHTEMRMRDGGHVGPNAGNSFFRGFYSSNFWFQEVYAYYTPGPFLKIKAGKVFRRFGVFWDDSFFGNVLFYDGLKLNPDYGISLEGERACAGGRLALSYSAQFFLHSDGINGGLDFGRTLPAVPMQTAAGMPAPKDLLALRTFSPNPEGQTDSGGNHVGAFRNLVVGRLAATLHPHRAVDVTLGASGQTGTVQRVSARDGFNDEARMTQVGGDVTLRLGPATFFGEYLRQMGPGVRDADYLWAGARVTVRALSLRLNGSYVAYRLDPDVEELILQPGLTFAIGYGLTAFLEFNEWERRDPRLPSGDNFTLYDRSVNLALGYSY